MNITAVCSALLIVVGVLFMIAGTVGLLRFPDIYTRLHALTKADNLGLGLIALGLMFQAASAAEMVKLLAIWLLAMLAGAAASFLVGRNGLRSGVAAWRKS